MLVGNQYDGKKVTSLENPIGLQDSSARGDRNDGGEHNIYPSIGVVPFSSSNSWGSSVLEIYLYGSDNLINGYLLSYKDSLRELGLETKEVTLITKNEMKILGCDFNYVSCRNAPSWVNQTTYWSRSGASTNYIWCVTKSNYGYSSYYFDENNGVRPVIVFDESVLG